MTKFITTDASTLVDESIHSVCFFDEFGILEKYIRSKSNITNTGLAERHSLEIAIDKASKIDTKEKIIIFSDCLVEVKNKQEKTYNNIEICWFTRKNNKTADYICSREFEEGKMSKKCLFENPNFSNLLFEEISDSNKHENFKDMDLKTFRKEKSKKIVKLFLLKYKNFILMPFFDMGKFENWLKRKNEEESLEKCLIEFFRENIVKNFVEKQIKKIREKSDEKLSYVRKGKEQNQVKFRQKPEIKKELQNIYKFEKSGPKVKGGINKKNVTIEMKKYMEESYERLFKLEMGGEKINIEEVLDFAETQKSFLNKNGLKYVLKLYVENKLKNKSIKKRA